MKNAGYTLVDAAASVVLVLVAGVLACVVVGSTTSCGRVYGCRPLCAANLNALGKALDLYANDSNGAPPILPDIKETEAADYRQPLKLGDDYTAASLGTGAQQNLCLLVKKNIIGWNVFLCPEVGKSPPHREGKVGMGDGKTSYCDYAIQIPYAKTPDGDNAAPLSLNMNPDMVILADQGNANPADNKTRWSPNHSGESTNVLTAGYSVRFCSEAIVSPRMTGPESIPGINRMGYHGNNIYLADKWAAGPDKVSPKLVAIGDETVTPTDKNAIYDSVLYSWQP